MSFTGWKIHRRGCERWWKSASHTGRIVEESLTRCRRPANGARTFKRKLNERRTMDEPPTIHPQGPGDEPPGWPAPPQPREVAQRSLLRRLLALLVAGGAAFTLSPWALVPYQNPIGILSPPPRPA